jgi:hypothetical protein
MLVCRKVEMQDAPGTKKNGEEAAVEEINGPPMMAAV